MKILKCIFLLIFAIKCASSASFFQKSLKFMKEQADAIIVQAGGNTLCAEHLKALLTDIIYRKTWAWEMIDATAKLQPGITAGNLFQVGNYDQCLRISENKNGSRIKGQYCTVVLLPSSNFSSEFSFLLDSRTLTDWTGVKKSYHISDILSLIKMTYGICIPSSCSIGNLQKIWDYVEHTFALSMHVMFYDLLCSHEGKAVEPFPIDVYIFAFFGVMFAIVLASTVYDFFIHQNSADAEIDNCWMAFSLYTNIQRLLSTSSENRDNRLDCLNGLKVLSMLWVLQGHRFAANVFSGNINSFYLFEWRKNLENTIIIGGSFSVDTFFVLSGLLLTYIFLNGVINEKRKINLIWFYAIRFIRLMPALLATILFYIGVMKYLSSGPMWPLIIKKISGSCYHTWWATLFFMTNMFDLNYQCVEQSWYLAVDTQLYFISPIILINLIKNPYRTFVVSSCVALVSIIYTFIITVNNNYGAVYFEGNKDYHQYVYQPTFVRMPAWLVGVFFGYVIFKCKQFKISTVLNLSLWALTLSSMAGIILSHLLFTRNDYNAVRSGLFNSLSRPIWSLAVSMVVFLCATGNGGVVTKILTLRVFNVLVKLSYSTYLVHLGVIFYLVGGKRTFDHFSNIRGFHDFWGDFVFTIGAASVMYLTFESPFITILKLMYKMELAKNKLKSKELAIKNISLEGKKKNYVICVYSYDKMSKNEKKKLKKQSKKKIKEI